MTAITIDRENNLTTMDLPHKAIAIPKFGVRLFIARRPLGDYSIHESYSRDGQGYGGAVVDFLMEDGTTVSVKGPYTNDTTFRIGESVEEAELLTGCPGIKAHANRLRVGRHLSIWGGKKPAVLHEEPHFVLSDWESRLRPEWEGLEIGIVCRHSTMYPSLDSLHKLFSKVPL